MYLLVDPIVLHLPESTATPNQINYFFTNLRKWNQFIRINQGNHEFCMTQVCRYALGAAYPSRNSLEDLITRTKNCVFDANTGYSACQYLLTAFAGWPHFEQIVALPLDNFAFDDDDMCLDPDLVRRAPTEIAESLQETFAYVAYAKEIDKNPIASDLLLLTHPIADSDKIEIDVHLLVDDPDEWQQTQTDLPMVGTPRDIARLKGLTQIWADTKQAIDLAKDQVGIGTDKKLSLYTVGPEFNDSLQDCQFPTHPHLLDQCFEKIAQLLAGESMSSDYALRAGEGPNDKQRTQKVGESTWKARRLRITGGKGAVYRLHYWHSDGEYVLSNIVPKNKFDICEINEEIVAQIK